MRGLIIAFVVQVAVFCTTSALADDAEVFGVPFDYMTDTDFAGSDLRGQSKLTGSDVTKCSIACVRTQGCRAFTFNPKGGTCFLKGGPGRLSRFPGVTSGLRLDGNLVMADLLPELDLRDDERLAVQRALNKRGFAAGRPDGAFGRRTRGAIRAFQSRSGDQTTGYLTDKQLALLLGGDRALARTFRVDPRTDLSWTASDDASSFVGRVRKASRQTEELCSPQKELLRSALTSVRADVRQGSDGRVIVDWSSSTAQPRLPTYLVVSTNRSVRFEGVGFYALTPNAIGPFGIGPGSDQHRAIVTLSSLGTARGGTISVEPLLEGAFTLNVASVGYATACVNGEVVRPLETLETNYSPDAKPILVVNDPFSTDDTTRRFLSADGQRVLFENDGTFQLRERDGSGIILQLDGREPRFSPTGRFLVVRRSGGFEIFDALDGTKVVVDRDEGSQFGDDADVAWAADDSFAYIGRTRYGFINVWNTLIADAAPMASLGRGIRIARGYTKEGVRLDLENGIVATRVLAGAGTGEGAYHFLRARNFDEWKQQQAQGRTVAPSIGEFRGTAKVVQPRGWDMRGPPRFTHVLENYATSDSGDMTANETPKGQIVARRRLEAEGRNDRLVATEVEAIRLRPAMDGTDATVFSSFWDDLARLGLRTRSPLAPRYRRSEFIDYRAVNPNYDAAKDFGRAVVKLVESDVPQARGMLVDRRDSEVGLLACRPSFDSNDGRVWQDTNLAIHYMLDDRPIWIQHTLCAEGTMQINDPTLMVYDPRRRSGWFKPNLRGSETLGTGCESIPFCRFDVELDPKGLLIFHSSESRAIGVVAVDSGLTIFKRYQLPGGERLAGARLTEDGRHIVQRNSDGTFHVHEIEGSADKAVLSGVHVDGEVVVYDDDLRFDATAEGASFVHLRLPGHPGQYSLQQFGSQLRSSQLVSSVLSKAELGPVGALQPPPRIDGSVRANGSRIEGQIELQSPAIRQIRVYQDGVLTDTIGTTPGRSQIEIAVDRVPSARWVSLVAETASGAVSSPIGRDLGGQSSPTRTHVLIVAVDRYVDPAIADLDFARLDGLTLAESLQSVAEMDGTIEIASLNVLLDEAATPAAVSEATWKLAAATGPTETAVVFFAGHGVRGADGRFYLAGTDTKATDISGTALGWDSIGDTLAKAEGRVAILLDACQAGAAGTSFFATNDEVSAGVSKRIPSGLAVFSAAKGRQFSAETSAGNGVFTAAVASVLTGERSEYDRNANGRIEVSELYRGVRRIVSDQRGALQTPWLTRNELVGDFSLF